MSLYPVPSGACESGILPVSWVDIFPLLQALALVILGYGVCLQIVGSTE